MTTHDLLELAVLDAHGMLDDDERRGFERSLNAASEPVRRQIQREQARLVDLTGLLPEVSPPESLRERVLDAVRSEIRTVQETARAQESAEPTPERRTVAHAAAVSGSDIPTPRRLRRTTRVNALWRAGSLGLSAAAITMAVMMVNLRNDYMSLAALHDDNLQVDGVIQGMGSPNVIDILYGERARVTFGVEPDAAEYLGDAQPRAVVYFYQDRPEFTLHHLGLPALAENGGQYQLAVLRDTGDVDRVIHEFTSDGSVAFPTISIKDVSVSENSRLAILHVSASGQSRLLLTARRA